MDDDRPKDIRRQAAWGVLVAALGVFFLFREFAAFDIPDLGELWPAFIVAFGVIRLVTGRSPADFASGIGIVLFGIWFFANELGWWGLTYRTSWPVVLVIVGLGSVLRALLEAGARGRSGGGS